MANKHRTLLRLYSYSAEKRLVKFIVPGWDPKEPISLSRHEVPQNVLNAISAGTVRFHARADLTVESAVELEFVDWEVG